MTETEEQLTKVPNTWIRTKDVQKMLNKSGHDVTLSSVRRTLNRLVKWNMIEKKEVRLKHGHACEFRKVT